MAQNGSFRDFLSEQANIPGGRLFLALDLAGLVGVGFIVIDDVKELGITVVFLGVLLWGQYKIFQKYRKQLSDYEQAIPQIECSQILNIPFHRTWLITSDTYEEIEGDDYECIQICFFNQPKYMLENTVAKDVTALITISAPDGSILIQYYGQWVETTTSDKVDLGKHLDSVTITPSLIPSKLFLAVKNKKSPECYALTPEGMSWSNGECPKYKLQPGSYIVKVHLRGIGVDKLFQFSLTNFGKNGSIKMEYQN